MPADVERYLRGIKDDDRHVFLDEAGACVLDSATDQRLVLALGAVLAPAGSRTKTRTVLLQLREETVAGLWAGVVGEVFRPLGRSSWLHRMPASWSQLPLTDEDEEDEESDLFAVLEAQVDEVWDVRPTALGGLTAGRGDRKRVRALLVGQRGRTRTAVLLSAEYARKLWSILLLGPGAVFAARKSRWVQVFDRLGHRVEGEQS